jgi:hypothetical protein
VLSRLIAIYRRAVKLVSALRGHVVESSRWLSAVFVGPRFVKIAVEFFTEAAVLVAVFPILDTIIQVGGMQKVTWSLVAWSEGIAGMLIVFAGILSELAERTRRY